MLYKRDRLTKMISQSESHVIYWGTLHDYMEKESVAMRELHEKSKYE